MRASRGTTLTGILAHRLKREHYVTTEGYLDHIRVRSSYAFSEPRLTPFSRLQEMITRKVSAAAKL